MVLQISQKLAVSERRACDVLEQCRATQRYNSSNNGGEARLAAQIIELATRYGRYGYRRITAMLQQEGWKEYGEEKVLKCHESSLNGHDYG